MNLTVYSGMVMFVALLLVSIGNGQTTSKDCTPATTCSQCLRADGQCYWCEDTDFTSSNNTNRARCNLRSELEAQNCKSIVIKDGSVTYTENNPFSSTVQVMPQKVTVVLRPAQTKEVRVKVQPAINYPVKLYYLMDLSKSMYDDLQNLMGLGTQIANTIKKITENYKLAFGTFVDKTVAPFIQPELLDRPCDIVDSNNKRINCVKTFSFHHVFNFSEKSTEFEEKVKMQMISGNLDTPEGGFDALMQIAACPNELQWGSIKESRRLVVFVTDASPHIAGDGKIGGIIAPNDEQCYLNSNHITGALEYSKADEMDYPSLSALKAKLKAAKIIPIFAVTKDVKDVYQNIVKEWEDLLAKAGDLETDSSNIVALINAAYNEIVSTARLTHDTKDFTVSYKLVESTCPKKVKDNECTNMKAGEAVEFIVDITAKKCPDNWKANKQFLINIPGFSEIEVTVQMICDCECESDASKIENNSPKCNGTGSFQCGICKCPVNRFGSQCQCDSAAQADQSLCKTKGELESVCSAQGLCICGECVCNKREDPTQVISGRYCECNNWNCPRFNGLLCGGRDRGVCECGRCICNEAYLGINCGNANCTIGARKCLKDGKVCSGNGRCDCDRCVCETGYRGTHCENCVSCESKCKDNKECVLCQAFNEPSKEECDKRVPKCNLNIELVNKTDEQCAFKDDNDCYVVFSFSQEVSLNETIKVQKEKRCILIVKRDPNILAIVLGTIGGIVLLCLILLLLWKLLITAYDNYEYHKFEKDRMKSRWENAENPIYRPSKQQFQNPTFSGNK